MKTFSPFPIYPDIEYINYIPLQHFTVISVPNLTGTQNDVRAAGKRCKNVTKTIKKTNVIHIGRHAKTGSLSYHIIGAKVKG